MGDSAHSDFPAALSRAQRKIEQWRQRHCPRARIPEELWREAAELACAYGMNRTAKALRLDYYSLKKRVAAVARSGKRVAAATRSGKRLAAVARSGKRLAAVARSGKRLAAATRSGKRVAAVARSGKRVAAAARSGKRVAAAGGSGERAAAFVEILPGGMPAPRPECTIEVEDGSGAKMRIRLQGGDLPDVTALIADVAALAGVFRLGRS